jgi:serine/threonine-protein kinase
MSPEQCAADKELDGRSDLYSLGAVAYHMLTGEPPFTGNTTPAVMLKQVTEAPMPVRQRRPEVPKELARIVMRLLEKDPAHRFADGAALVAALDGATVAAPAPVRLPETAHPTGRRPGATPDERAAAAEKVGDALDRQLDRMMTRRELRDARRRAKEDAQRRREEAEESRPMADRIRRFRRHFASYTATSLFLFGINAMTTGGHHHFWWAVFPALGMGMSLLSEGGRLWASGARLRDVFGSSEQALPHAPPAPPAAVGAGPSSADALPAQYADAVQQAAANRRTVHDLVDRLSESERALLPDVRGTADSLYERVEALATALHRLDTEVVPERLPALDERIRRIEQSPDGGTDRARRLGLLQRQRQMLADLIRARDTLLEQYESAGLLLENLALDLLKVRSSGLKSALDGVTSVTQEARALSREIGYVLDAADELRALEGREARSAGGDRG